MPKIVFILTSLISFSASATELLCSPSPIHIEYKVPTSVWKKQVNYNGEIYGFVHLWKKEARLNPNHHYTDLRVSANGLQWSIMCVDQEQLAHNRALGLIP